MNAYIKTLQNYNKSEIIYPVTKAGAVYLDNSETVEDALKDVATKEYVNNITSIKETNKNLEQKFWRGTQDEYDAIATKDDNTMYIITDEGNNGDSGSGAVIGNMQSSVYDPQGKATDIFAYVDSAIEAAFANIARAEEASF